MNLQAPDPVQVCVPCTLLTTLVAMIVVVGCNLQLIDQDTTYTRRFVSERLNRTIQITVVVDQQIRVAIVTAPFAAEEAPTMRKHLHN